ncbi:MAG: hypothetical protein Q8P18_16805 [Pseudomonadota bacterium]|nr:hypothetical protein [Pseudomonadota bacterium]
MHRLVGLTALLALFAAGPAFAAPKDKDKEKSEEEEDYSDEPMPDEGDFEEEGGDVPTPKRLDEGDKSDEEAEPDDLDFDDEEEEDLEFRDEEDQETIKPRGPGEDTAQIYRDTQKKLTEVTPDEELIAWEAYLKKYPKSLFRERIETRTEELSAELFGERVPGSDTGARREDAANRELNFTSPLQFASADPRSRIGATAELGIPNWFAPHLDAEFQILRHFSVHAGLDQDVSGIAINLGAKYALLKSARTNTVLSGALDFKLNTDPAFPILRPALMAGQRLPVLEGLYLQAEVGVDAELRDPAGVRLFYGFNAELRANEVVYAYLETTGTLKYLGSQDFGSFQFMVASFGMKFVPSKGGFPSQLANKQGLFITHEKKPIVIVLGANIPYSARYWGFYRGSVTVGAEWYL